MPWQQSMRGTRVPHGVCHAAHQATTLEGFASQSSLGGRRVKTWHEEHAASAAASFHILGDAALLTSVMQSSLVVHSPLPLLPLLLLFPAPSSPQSAFSPFSLLGSFFSSSPPWAKVVPTPRQRKPQVLLHPLPKKS